MVWYAFNTFSKKYMGFISLYIFKKKEILLLCSTVLDCRSHPKYQILGEKRKFLNFNNKLLLHDVLHHRTNLWLSYGNNHVIQHVPSARSQYATGVVGHLADTAGRTLDIWYGQT